MSSSLLPSPPFHFATLTFPQTALSYLRSSRPITEPFIPTNHKPTYSDQSQSGQTPKDLYIKKAIKTADTFIHSYIHSHIGLYKQKTHQREINHTARPQCLVDRCPALPNRSRQLQQLSLEYCRRITPQPYGTPQHVVNLSK
jgi:hypothetical protein